MTLSQSPSSSPSPFSLSLMDYLKRTYIYDIDHIKLLLENENNIEGKDYDGNTCFILVCMSGHTETVKLLLERGVNIHEKNNDGETGFMEACKKNILKLLNYC
jgi:ankyrin repeat protein